MNSLIPRGVRRFHLATDVSAKPVNDQISLLLTATLPANFAYILKSFNWQLSVDTVSEWANTVLLRMFNHIPGQPLGTAEHVSCSQTVFDDGISTPVAVVRAFDNGVSSFAGPVWATHGGAITFRAQAGNGNANVGAAGFVTSHVEFLEYDLTQAQRFYLNTPTPVIGR